MADPNIWSWLPLELLYFVVGETDDTSSLKAWSRVGLFNGLANSRLWEDVRISQEDLLRVNDYLPLDGDEDKDFAYSSIADTQQTANEDAAGNSDASSVTNAEHSAEPEDSTEDNSEHNTGDDKAQSTYGSACEQWSEHEDEHLGTSSENYYWIDEPSTSRGASDCSEHDSYLSEQFASENNSGASFHGDDVYIIGGSSGGSMCAPEDEVTEGNDGAEEQVKLPSKGTCMLEFLHRPVKKSTPSLLPSIKKLLLDFQFTNTSNNVASEDVDLSVATVLSNATKLQQIKHTGILYQEILDLVVRASRPQVLSVREAWPKSPCTFKDEASEDGFSFRPWTDLQLDLYPIGQMSALRTLRVSGLLPNEGISLAKAVRELHLLEDLHISAVLHSSRAVWPLTEDGMLHVTGSPIDDFLIEMYGPFVGAGEGVKIIGFPKSLKSLSLLDRDFSLTRLTSDYIKNRFRAIPSLTKLCVNCHFINKSEWINLAEVLRALMTPQITHLTLPICETLKFSLPDKLLQQDALVEVLLPFKDSIDTWVLCADPSMELLDLPLRKKLEVLWKTNNIGRQLHTAVEPREWYRESHPSYLRDHSLSTYLIGLDPTVRHPGPPYEAAWVPGLRHLRLESVDISKLEIDLIDDPMYGLKELKVFVSSTSRTSFDSNHRIVPRASPRHFSELKFPQRANDFTEGRLASELAAQNLPCLRIIVFGGYQFWIERIPDQARPQLWYLHEALGDPEQRKKVMDCLDKKDWQFLQNPSEYQAAEIEETTLPERLTVYRLNKGAEAVSDLCKALEAHKI